MEKGKSCKNLREKMLFLMCLGTLAGNMGTEVYAQDNIPILDFSTSGITASNKSEEYNDTDLIINRPEEKYALYSKSSASMGTPTASIKINENNNKNIIQITGDIVTSSGFTESATNSKAEIEVSLNGEKSFFAGKMLSESIEGYTEGEEKITLNLKDGATWYAHDSNGKDSYNISGGTADSLDGNLQTLITSNGGVIDVYNATPDKTRVEYFSGPIKEELNTLKIGLDEVSNLDSDLAKVEKILKKMSEKLSKETFEQILKEISGDTAEAKIESFKQSLVAVIDNKEKEIINIQEKENFGARTLTLNGVGDRLQNTTFRISTDVENKKSDKIVLNGVEVKKDSETYFIEIAADPFKSGEWKADKDDKILVMDINGNGLDKITVEGKECEAEIGAGLVKQKIIPTVEEDTANKGDWYLTSIDKIESKGSGHIFAEIGAAANIGMASAWRTDSGDLYQRMGNLRNNEAEQGVWGRIYTGENEIRKGIGLDLEYRAVQVGYDRKENIDSGKLFTGIAFGYFDGNADYDHGSGESNSVTVGMYATYSGNNGSFGDFIVKLGNIDNKLSYTSESGDYYKADYDTYGFSADAEYGYRYEFSNDYYIEPLAQLSYIYIADEEYTMNLNGESGAKVSNDDYQSLIGYAGFHYGKKFGDNVAYLRVAAAHEFAGDIDVDARYQDIKVNSSISGEDTWVEYGVGFDVKVKEDTAVYGRLQKSTGDVVKNKWHASVGIRYTF